MYTGLLPRWTREADRGFHDPGHVQWSLLAAGEAPWYDKHAPFSARSNPPPRPPAQEPSASIAAPRVHAFGRPFPSVPVCPAHRAVLFTSLPFLFSAQSPLLVHAAAEKIMSKAYQTSFDSARSPMYIIPVSPSPPRTRLADPPAILVLQQFPRDRIVVRAIPRCLQNKHTPEQD